MFFAWIFSQAWVKVLMKKILGNESIAQFFGAEFCDTDKTTSSQCVRAAKSSKVKLIRFFSHKIEQKKGGNETSSLEYTDKNRRRWFLFNPWTIAYLSPLCYVPNYISSLNFIHLDSIVVMEGGYDAVSLHCRLQNYSQNMEGPQRDSLIHIIHDSHGLPFIEPSQLGNRQLENTDATLISSIVNFFRTFKLLHQINGNMYSPFGDF